LWYAKQKGGVVLKEKLPGVFQAVLIALVIVSGAIALPVLFRPFFYWHIGPLNLCEMVNLTTEQVKTAYNEMMDYCIGVTHTFSAGVLPFSEEGASHFADVQKLFVLDLRVLIVSSVLLLALLLRKGKKSVSLLGHTPGFWGAIGLTVSFLVIGGLAALDFDKAFVIFHKLFFPGKDNWLFNSYQDPIINMLPAEFFRNCAILILASILLTCSILIVYDLKHKKTRL
jgi:integral membrane protein (TIGR01906 family)